MEDASKQEILEAIGSFAEQVDQRFAQIDRRFEHIESQMVTKSYLDDKLSDFRADLVGLIKREDARLFEKIKGGATS